MHAQFRTALLLNHELSLLALARKTGHQRKPISSGCGTIQTVCRSREGAGQLQPNLDLITAHRMLTILLTSLGKVLFPISLFPVPKPRALLGAYVLAGKPSSSSIMVKECSWTGSSNPPEAWICFVRARLLAMSLLVDQAGVLWEPPVLLLESLPSRPPKIRSQTGRIVGRQACQTKMLILLLTREIWRAEITHLTLWQS